MKRTGFISIVGRPNVGKSTLLNSILGEKIAIVSNKPQTTRNRIAGIETRGEDQFVFLDTPGIFKPQNSLGDFMVKTANSTMQEGDMVILVADVGYRPGDVEEGIIAYLKKSGTPAILALNKVDLYRREQIAETIAAYAALHNFEAVVPISAKKGKYVNEVLDECAKLLREGDWFYDEDMITDQPQRQMVAEIIREKILRTLDKEIPHGVAIVVEEYRDEGIIVPTDRVFVNIFRDLLVILSSSDNVIVKSSLPYILAVFFIAKSFERRYKMRHEWRLLCRGRRPRRPVLMNKQYKMDMIWHNNVLIYG